MLSPRTFRHQVGRACLETALRDVYEHHGFRFEEHQLFGLGAGLHFDYACVVSEQRFDLGVFSPSIDVALLTNTGVRFRHRYESDPARATRRMRELLVQGEPVALKLHPRACAALMRSTPTALVPFLPAHWVVALAYDDAADVVHYVDNRSTRSHTMSLADWEAARHGGTDWSDPNGAWLELEFPTRLVDPAFSHWAAIAQVVFGMRHVASPVLPIGVAALERYTRHLKRWPALFAADARRANAARMTSSMTAAGAVKGAFRVQYALFLREAAAVLDAPALEQAAVAYRECAALWHTHRQDLDRIADDPDDVSPWVRGSPFFATLDALNDAEHAAVHTLARALPRRPRMRGALATPVVMAEVAA